MVTPNDPTKYKGTTQYLTPNVTRNRRPTGADFRQPETGKNYPIACIWQVGLGLNRSPPTTGSEGELWILTRIDANVAYWVQIASGAVPVGPVLTLSDDSNTITDPSILGNIQIEGTAHEIAVTAGVNKLVISQPNGIPTVGLVLDANSPVVPSSLGVITLTGSTSTFTTGTSATAFHTEVQGTAHALKLGRGALAASVDLAPGATGTILQAVTGADPAWSGAITAWTPVISGGTVAGAGTYTTQIGQYSRIGNTIFFWANIAYSAHTGTGDMTLSGFPVAFSNTAAYISTVLMSNVTLPANTNWVNFLGTATTTKGTFPASISAAPASNVQMANASSAISVSGFYSVV